MQQEAASLTGRAAATDPESGREHENKETRGSRDGDGGDAHHKRHLGPLSVAVLSYAAVAGGPYGIEAAVGAAGALPVLVGSVILAITWSGTQALVASELSTAFPSNAGYISWVVRGCGPVLGFVNAANCMLSAVCNLPLYPVLFASYISTLFPDLPDPVIWAVKLVSLLLTVGLNVLGIQTVETASAVFSVIVQTPFILIPIVAAAKGVRFDWAAAGSVAPGFSSGISLFVSTLCWNSQGWMNAGNLASEVRDPSTSYPIGSAVAVVAVALNYIYPVLLCVALAPDPAVWNTGYFTTLASRIAPWLGYWTTVASMFSSANNFLPQLGTTARALRFAALYNMVPVPALRHNWARTHAPVAAILLQAAVVGVLMFLSFDVLVIVNVMFYNVGLLLQFCAFLRLRYTDPELPRPYQVPGGKLGAWVVFLTFASVLVVAVFAAAADSWWALAVVGGANVLFLAAGVAWARWGYSDGLLEAVDAAEVAGMDAAATAAAVGAGAMALHDEAEEADEDGIASKGRGFQQQDSEEGAGHGEREPVTLAAPFHSAAAATGRGRHRSSRRDHPAVQPGGSDALVSRRSDDTESLKSLLSASYLSGSDAASSAANSRTPSSST